MNKHLLIGTLLFGGAAVTTYLVKRHIDRIRREMVEAEEVTEAEVE